MKHFLRSIAWVAMGAASLLSPMALQAAPLTVSAGQTFLFNVDMTGLGPVPFVDVEFRTQLVGASFNAAVDQGVWTFFTEAGGLGSASVVPNAGLTSTPLSLAGFLDGIFSASFHLDAGEVEIAPDVRGVVAIGGNEFAFTEALPLRGIAPPVVADVPEPASSALALAAWGGLLLARGRRRGRG